MSVPPATVPIHPDLGVWKYHAASNHVATSPSWPAQSPEALAPIAWASPFAGVDGGVVVPMEAKVS